MSKKELKYPPGLKTEVCEHAIKETIISASLIYNMDRNTISRWVKKFKSKGVDVFVTKRDNSKNIKLDDYISPN